MVAPGVHLLDSCLQDEDDVPTQQFSTNGNARDTTSLRANDMCRERDVDDVKQKKKKETEIDVERCALSGRKRDKRKKGDEEKSTRTDMLFVTAYLRHDDREARLLLHPLLLCW